MSHEATPVTDPGASAMAETAELRFGPFRLQYAALSDVGRVRKDNQDSGYAGPWLLTVCDGVGGAARGDIASATAVQQLRRLDTPPAQQPVAPGSTTTQAAVGTASPGAPAAIVPGGASDDLLTQVAGALHRAHDRIGELVEEDPSLSGTSTTATVAVFDGSRLGIGHLGDSRAYLMRGGAISQLTHDHTFVQSLIDEGRISEGDARTHPHRNLILKALDGVHEAEPDLFHVPLAIGDRILLCSDGASGVLDDTALAGILGTGTPDYAAVELVRASLEAGSSDNVTCVVADVVAADAPEDDELEPMLVGAAAELPRRAPRHPVRGRGIRGYLSGDSGEFEPVPAAPELPSGVGFAIPSDPIDPEQARYAPRPPQRFTWLRRFFTGAIVLGLLWVGAAAAWSWSQRQYYVAEQAGFVTIYRGVNADLPGLTLSRPYATTDVALDRLSEFDASAVRRGIAADTLADAERIVDNLAAEQVPGGAEPAP